MQEHNTFFFQSHRNLVKQCLALLPEQIQASFFQAEPLEEPSPTARADADLYLYLGNKAVTEGDYKAAILQFQRGIERLGKNLWEMQRRDLTLGLYSGLLKAEMRTTNFERSLAISDVLIDHADSDKLLVTGYNLKVQTLIVLSRVEEAIEAIFKLFGSINFSLEETYPDKISPAALIDLPEVKESWKVSLIGIVKTLTELLFISNQDYSKAICTQTKLCLDYGYNPLTLYCIVDRGLLACATNELEYGYTLGQFAIENIQPKNPSWTAVSYLFNAHIRHWKEPLKASITPLEETFRLGVESGKFMMAGTASIVSLDHRRASGENLASVAAKYDASINDLEALNVVYHIPYAQVGKKLVEQLQGNSSAAIDPFSFVQQGNYPAAFHAFTAEAIADVFLLKQPEAAIAAAQNASKYTKAAAGLILMAELNFYYSLALLEHCSAIPALKRRECLHQVAMNQMQMEKWAISAPMNFLHKFQLVNAEKSRVENSHREAMAFYEMAISGAKENGFSQDAAIANELAGKFYLRRKQSEIAKKYLIEAHSGFLRWGAFAIVKRLEKDYECLQPAQDEFLQELCNRFVASLREEIRQVLETQNVKIEYDLVAEKIVLVVKNRHIAGMLDPILRILKSSAEADVILRIEASD